MPQICLLLLLYGAQAWAQPRTVQLDSLKQVVRGNLPVAEKVAALNQLSGYYARIPQPDSTVKYCEMAVKLSVEADSFLQVMLLISNNEVMGTLNGVSSNYGESLRRYQGAYQSLQEVFTFPMSPKEAVMVHRQLVRIETYMGMVQHKLGHYRQADSIFSNAIRSAQGIPDTIIWVNSLLSRRALFQDMLRFMDPDSVGARARMKQQRDQVGNEGLKLLRLYLSRHPDDFQMQRFLVYLLSNQAANMISDPGYSQQQKTEVMSLLIEAMRVARQSGISGRDLLIPKVNYILLLRDLERYQKALETANEVIGEARAYKLPVIESMALKRRAQVLWQQKKYPEALADFQRGIELDVSVKDFAEAAIASDAAANKLSNMPLRQRLHYRSEKARFRQMGKTYRRQATEAGQTLPEKQTD